MRERKIVLLIDAENTSARYAKRIVEYLEKRGDIICARIYGDFINNNSVKGWNNVAIEYEMEQKQQLTTSSGKNSSDIALVIDAMDLLYQKNIDTLCIVTSDGDFTGLVKRIREDGIEVIGIGKTDASKRLEKVCDQYLDFEELGEQPKSNRANNRAENQTNDKSNKKANSKSDKNATKSDKGAGNKNDKGTGGKPDKGIKSKLNKISNDKKDKNDNSKLDKKSSDKEAAKDKSDKKQKNKLIKNANGKADKNQQKQEKNQQKQEKNQQGEGKSNKKVTQQSANTATSIDREKLAKITSAISNIVQQEEKKGKKAELGGIKSQLQLQFADFNEREFGYKSMRDFINKETKYEVITDGHHTYVTQERKAWDKRGIPRSFNKDTKDNNFQKNSKNTIKNNENVSKNNKEQNEKTDLSELLSTSQDLIQVFDQSEEIKSEGKRKFGFPFGGFRKKDKDMQE